MGARPILDVRQPAARLAPRAALVPALVLVALSVAVPALVTGCGRRDDVPLQPVYRLASLTQPARSKDVPARCETADEYRLAIGCIPYVPMLNQRLKRPQADEIRVVAEIPPLMQGGVMVLEPRVRDTRDWQRTGAQVFPPSRKLTTEVTVPLPGDLKGDALGVQIFGRPIPPNEREFTTPPLEIGRGARLSVGIGMDPLGKRLGASPVEFRLSVETADGTRDLLTETIDPLQQRGWADRTADLGDLAGQSVRFRFATRVVPRAGADPATAFGVPLWGSPQVLEPRRRDGRRNVVLISLDTLRGDQLDGSLDGVPLMPELRRIAARGTAFENAFSTYPSTSGSHMTMFTGLYPSAHEVVFATHVLAADIPTLPEILARHGYATVGVTEDAMLAAQAGFARGFDYYREFKGKNIWDTKGQIEETFGTGLRWIEEHPDERFFLFLHTYEVHVPYEPPPEYDIFKTWQRDGEQVPIDADTPKFVVDRHHYAGEARYTDAIVKRLFDRLDELDLLDETIVVVTSDHGDEFGEHGMIGHAKHAYDEVLHVPFVIVAPGLVPRGDRIATPVSLVDLMPTLLSLVDVEAPAGLHGRSLVPLLRGEPFPSQRVLYAEAPAWGKQGKRRIAARAAGFKFIASDHERVPGEIYDLTVDPTEQAKVADPALEQAGRQLIAAYRRRDGVRVEKAAAPPANPLADSKPELDERTVEKLKQLGYVD